VQRKQLIRTTKAIDAKRPNRNYRNPEIKPIATKNSITATTVWILAIVTLGNRRFPNVAPRNAAKTAALSNM
jgi:hypothetical protein